MKVVIRVMLAALVCVSSQSWNAFAAAPAVGGGLEEELLFGEIPQVVTASRKAESVDQAPNTMYVFTADEIRRRGFRKLEDLLSIVPGMTVLHRDLQLVGVVRGVAPNDNEKIAWMVDGHIINGVTQPEVMSGPINFDAVERVEIIVGPGSVLYGPDPLLATVNLITKKVEGHELTVSAGDRGFRSQSGTAAMGQKWSDTRFLTFSGTYVEKEGYGAEMSDTWPRPADTVYQPRAAQLFPSYYLNGRAQFDDWTLQAISLNTDLFHLDAAQDPNNPEDGLNRRRYEWVDSLILNKDDHWTDNLLGTLRFSYDSKRQNWRTLSGVPGDTTAGKPGDSFDYDFSEHVYNFEYSLQHKTEKNFLQGGVQWAHKQHRANNIMQIDPAEQNTSTTTTDGQFINQLVRQTNTNTVGAYVSEEYQATDKLKLVGAIRADQDSSLGNNKHKIYAGPRVAAIYSPTEKWTTKLMYNTATRIPSPWNGPLNNVWGNDKPGIFLGGFNFGNRYPNANKPERLRSVEWQNIVYKGPARMSATVYYQKLKDYITFFNPWTNAGDFEAKGVDADASYKLGSSVKLRAGASYVKTHVLHALIPGPGTGHHAVNDKGEMLAAPQILANAGFDWNITRPLFFSATVRYFTKQAATVTVPSEQSFYVYNRTYVDAALTWENVLKNTNVQLAGRNLTNNREFVAVPQQRQTALTRGVEGSLTVSTKF